MCSTYTASSFANLDPGNIQYTFVPSVMGPEHHATTTAGLTTTFFPATLNSMLSLYCCHHYCCHNLFLFHVGPVNSAPPYLQGKQPVQMVPTVVTHNTSTLSRKQQQQAAHPHYQAGTAPSEYYYG